MRYRTFTSQFLLTLALASLMHAQQPEPVPAASTEQEIEQLKQQLDELIQKEKASEAAAANANAALVTADSHGFTIKSQDGDFLLNIGADIQVDSRSYIGAGAPAISNNIVLRRARPVLQGTVHHYIDYFFRPDFGLGSVMIYDAYAELTYFSRARLRVGKFKPPVGLERLQSDDDTTFVERGLPSALAPQRDIGFQLSGDVIKNRFNYSAAILNGVPDGSLSDAAVNSHHDFAGRIFLTPFQPQDNSVLRGLGFGIGASSGNTDGEGLPSFKTFGQNNLVTFASGVSEAGHRTRLQPQLYYYLGGFGLLSEYGVNEEDLQKGAFRTDMGFRAWQVETSYILTGEKKSFGGPSPKHIFDPGHGGWGAFELAFRIGGFSADRALYADGFASPGASPRTAHERVAAVNWYLNRLFKISADYGITDFGGGAAIAAGGNKPDEKAVIVRFQLNFVGS